MKGYTNLQLSQVQLLMIALMKCWFKGFYSGFVNLLKIDEVGSLKFGDLFHFHTNKLSRPIKI